MDEEEYEEKKQELEERREDEEDYRDNLQDMQDNQENFGYPDPPEKESIFKFFRYIHDQVDSKKTGFLIDSEVGSMPLTVRSYYDLAYFCNSQDLNIIGEYMRQKGEIQLATGLSRKGFLQELFVTQIKKQHKSKIGGQKAKSFFQKLTGKKDDSTEGGE